MSLRHTREPGRFWLGLACREREKWITFPLTLTLSPNRGEGKKAWNSRPRLFLCKRGRRLHILLPWGNPSWLTDIFSLSCRIFPFPLFPQIKSAAPRIRRELRLKIRSPD